MLQGRNGKYKILLTGGHAATTAIAVVGEARKKHPEWELYWVGVESAVEGKYVPTLAAKVMPGLGVKFIGITTGRLQRKFTVWTIPSLLKVPYGFIQAVKILLNIKPGVIVAFGGYASVPVCFAGWLLGIPVIIHEQTVAVGLANKINSYFARKITIAREESRKYFTKETVLVGNPVSEVIKRVSSKREMSDPPVIYITGGSSGAQRINDVVGESLYELLRKYIIIHQTGKLDFEKFREKKGLFPSDLKEKYEVYDFIDPKEMGEIFERADIIISRAGANTVSEMMVARRPGILIPIPWTAHDEQTENAKSIVKSGLGVILPEKDLNSENFLKTIEMVRVDWKKMVEESDMSLAELDRNAAEKMVREIEELLK